MILTGETEEVGEILVPVSLSTINPTWSDPGANPGLRGVSHGTVVWWNGDYQVKTEELGEKTFFSVASSTLKSPGIKPASSRWLAVIQLRGLWRD
jgi:hypothetical protein